MSDQVFHYNIVCCIIIVDIEIRVCANSATMILLIFRKCQRPVNVVISYRKFCQKSISNDLVLIPRVDLGMPTDEIVHQILRAARSGGPGFFYLLNHGIEHSVFENTIKEARNFYLQPLEKKMEISFSGYAGSPLNKSSKGYTNPGFEGNYAKDVCTDIRPNTEQASEEKNMRESLVYRYPELNRNERPYLVDYKKFIDQQEDSIDPIMDISVIGPAAQRFYAPNQWPNQEQFPNFRSAIEAYLEEMAKIAEKMFEMFLLALRKELNVSTDHHFYHYDTAMTTFNLAHYPPSTKKGLGISDHTDWELFTLLYPNFYPIKNDVAYTGLEIWYQGGWVRVPHIPGAIIVNQGEMLSRFSKGRFKPPLHRVQAMHKKDRYSLVSFWAPNYETRLPDSNTPSKHVLSGEYYLMRNNMV